MRKHNGNRTLKLAARHRLARADAPLRRQRAHLARACRLGLPHPSARHLRRHGKNVTPHGLTWGLEQEDGSWWLTLNLDDSQAPRSRMSIDPATETYRASNSREQRRRRDDARDHQACRAAGRRPDDRRRSRCAAVPESSPALRPRRAPGRSSSRPTARPTSSRSCCGRSQRPPTWPRRATPSRSTPRRSCPSPAAVKASGGIAAFYGINNTTPINRTAGWPTHRARRSRRPPSRTARSGTSSSAPTERNGHDDHAPGRHPHLHRALGHRLDRRDCRYEDDVRVRDRGHDRDGDDGHQERDSSGCRGQHRPARDARDRQRRPDERHLDRFDRRRQCVRQRHERLLRRCRGRQRAARGHRHRDGLRCQLRRVPGTGRDDDRVDAHDADADDTGRGPVRHDEQLRVDGRHVEQPDRGRGRHGQCHQHDDEDGHVRQRHHRSDRRGDLGARQLGNARALRDHGDELHGRRLGHREQRDHPLERSGPDHPRHFLPCRRLHRRDRGDEPRHCSHGQQLLRLHADRYRQLGHTVAVTSSPILVDTSTPASSTGTTGVSSLTFAATVPNKPMRMLVVGAEAEFATNNSCQASGVTYGGTPMTQIGNAATGTGSYDCSSLWYMAAPPVGTANVSSRHRNVRCDSERGRPLERRPGRAGSVQHELQQHRHHHDECHDDLAQLDGDRHLRHRPAGRGSGAGRGSVEAHGRGLDRRVDLERHEHEARPDTGGNLHRLDADRHQPQHPGRRTFAPGDVTPPTNAFAVTGSAPAGSSFVSGSTVYYREASPRGASSCRTRSQTPAQARRLQPSTL